MTYRDLIARAVKLEGIAYRRQELARALMVDADDDLKKAHRLRQKALHIWEDERHEKEARKWCGPKTKRVAA